VNAVLISSLLVGHHGLGWLTAHGHRRGSGGWPGVVGKVLRDCVDLVACAPCRRWIDVHHPACLGDEHLPRSPHGPHLFASQLGANDMELLHEAKQRLARYCIAHRPPARLELPPSTALPAGSPQLGSKTRDLMS